MDPSERNKGGDTSWRDFRRLLRLAAPARGGMALAVLLGCATIGSSVGLMATSAYLIAAAALHPSIGLLSIPIVGVRFFGIARGGFRYLERLVSHDATFRLLARVRVWAYESIEPLAPALFLRYRGGDLLARVVADVETLQHFFLRALAPPLVAAGTAVLAGALLYAFAPTLSYTALAFMAVAGIAAPLAAYRAGRSAGRQVVADRAELSAALVDGIQGGADLIALGQEARQSGQVRDLGRRLGRGQERLAALSSGHAALGGLLAHLAMWSVLALAIPMVADGRLRGVYLPVVTLATLAAFEAVLNLAPALQHLEGSLQAARRLFELRDARPTVMPPADPPPAPEHFAVEIVGLRFRYAPDEALALDGITLSLRPGRLTALVGSSGAGKSTLAALLLRFWDYHEGSIALGGRELRSYAPEDVRRWIGVLSQGTHLFNATVRENLLLARSEATEEEMVAAARQAGIHDFVAGLPQGYDTRIGEQGLSLSGGERQRLALARAILQETPILILDEATAHLDALTERHVLQTVRELARTRAVLLITHRLSGLDAADEVLVLRAGRVVERGTHAELMEMGGAYRRLWELQRVVG